MSTLTCRRCGKSNLAFTRDRITFCKSCGVNFVVDSDNAAQAAAWLKEKVPEIPKDTLICEYCGSCEEACPTSAITCPYDIVIEDEAV